MLTFLSQENKRCINWWIDKIRLLGKTSLKELYRRYYQEAKLEFPIGSEHLNQMLMTAINISRVAKKKRRNSPYLKSEMIVVKSRLLKIEKNNLGFLFKGETHWFPFKSQEIPKGILRQSTIKNVNGEWFCFLSVDVSEPKSKAYKKILGVDLGVAKIATMADKNGDRTRFFRGEPMRDKRNHYQNLRAKLQPEIKRGNVYRFLNRIAKKEANWMKDTNHKISREIVSYAKANKMSIAVENLSGIRERINTYNKKSRKMLSNWSFRQLVDFINYKARLAGLAMFAVDPRETSRKCPKCSNVSRLNRKSQSRFQCNKCQYSSNADRIGAMNIAQRAAGLSVNPLARGQLAVAPTSV